MIVDDSVVARAVLSRMVESDDAFELAAVAGTAEDAIDALQAVRVDTILLDLEMPGAGGLRSIPRILDNACGAHIMIVSSMAEEGGPRKISPACSYVRMVMDRSPDAYRDVRKG